MDFLMPIKLNFGDMLDEERFFKLCQINELVDFERDSQGNVIVLPLSGSFHGNISARLTAELCCWNMEAQLGEGFGSSTGFTLPNKAVRSPDASWLIMDKWNRLTEYEKERFAPVCPDFVAEIRRKSDDLKYLVDKMQEYIENGAQLGWMIDRFDKKAYIYRADGSVEIVGINVVLSGEDVLPGFSLDVGKLIK
jgi:Uma2 family endonuclease